MRIRRSLALVRSIPCSLLLLASAATALTAPRDLTDLEEADRKALETIASQPESVREAALKASQHVDALVETQRIQEQSSAVFQERVGKLDRAQQEELWDVVREPGLLAELAGDAPPSSAELDAITERHPEKLAPAIRKFGTEHHALLADIAAIHEQANDRFEVAIEDLPEDSKQAFRDLVDQPEILSLLSKRVRLAMRLGDSYRRDPEATRAHLAALGAEVDQRNVAARQEWVETMQNDPKATAELETSARAYADEYGYDYEELTRPEVRTTVHVVVHPFPFWFGYPFWYYDLYLYPYGYWYPYPAYFGFHHYHGHSVYWGFPSISFLHWFFAGHHHHHYAHLSDHFYRHHHHHRHARSHFHATVDNWARHRDHFRGDRDGRHGRHWSARRGGDGHGREWAGRGNAFTDRRDRVRVGRGDDRDRATFFRRGRPEERFRDAGELRQASRGPARERGAGDIRGARASRRDAPEAQTRASGRAARSSDSRGDRIERASRERQNFFAQPDRGGRGARDRVSPAVPERSAASRVREERGRSTVSRERAEQPRASASRGRAEPARPRADRRREDRPEQAARAPRAKVAPASEAGPSRASRIEERPAPRQRVQQRPERGSEARARTEVGGRSEVRLESRGDRAPRIQSSSRSRGGERAGAMRSGGGRGSSRGGGFEGGGGRGGGRGHR